MTEPATLTEILARAMFDAYNAMGPNPWKTFDGRDVPPWEGLTDQVRGKWLAAARAAEVRIQHLVREEQQPAKVPVQEAPEQSHRNFPPWDR